MGVSIYTFCGNYYAYLCAYMVMSNYLYVYVVMRDYLCVYIVMRDYLCVYIAMRDYIFFTVWLTRAKILIIIYTIIYLVLF